MPKPVTVIQVCVYTRRKMFMRNLHRNSFFNLLNENTILYLIKTKQNCYYLNLFRESIYFRIYVCFTHVGINVSAYTFLVSREDSRNSRSV